MNLEFGGILRVLFLAAVVTGAASAAHATNGHQLSAIGAYQQGMGGAVTAAPYDATTAITNPAGMAMIGSRTDFSFEMFMPKREITFPDGTIIESGSNLYIVPAIGWTAPANERGDVFFGGGMYGVSGMGVDFTTSNSTYDNMNIYSQYQFWKMAPTIAWKGSKMAVGFSLNLDYQAFAFENYMNMGGTKFGLDLSEMQGALGAGATVGIIYQPSPAFALGLSYASKQFFTDFKWRLDDGDVNVPTPAGNITSQKGIYSMNLSFPQQAAIGMAVRPGRPVLWTLDVKWINFSDTYDIVKLKGNYSGGVKELPLQFGWDDVWVIATGLQIDVTPNTVLRIGYNHSNSPIKAEDVDNNMAFPAIVEDRVSGGFTYRFGRNWEMTMAYMKALKNEITSDSGSDATISLEEDVVDFEISYRF